MIRSYQQSRILENYKLWYCGSIIIIIIATILIM